jgi:hypothetical protein
MKEVISRLHKGLTLDEIAVELKTTARSLKKSLHDKYPLPKLKFSVGIELEGYSSLGIYNMVDVLRDRGVDIQYRDWQSESLTGIDNWTLTTDGSIQGFKGQEEKGQEIVSPPIYTMRQMEELKLIVETIRSGEHMKGKHNIYRINKSCGLHVHFGVYGRNETFLKKAYQLYRIFEPYLDGMLAKSRQFNRNHCKSVTDMDFDTAISARTDKYWSIKVKRNAPTIEFRKHQGCANYYRILYWVLILQQILLEAEKIKSVSMVENSYTFEYFYQVIANPILISYYNERKRRFDEKKGLDEGFAQAAVDTVLKKMSLTVEDLPF